MSFGYCITGCFFVVDVEFWFSFMILFVCYIKFKSVVYSTTESHLPIPCRCCDTYFDDLLKCPCVQTIECIQGIFVLLFFFDVSEKWENKFFLMAMP